MPARKKAPCTGRFWGANFFSNALLGLYYETATYGAANIDGLPTLMTSDSSRPEGPLRGNRGLWQYSDNPPPQYTPTDDQIDLGELWSVIWRGKWIVVTVATVFAIASVMLALSMPNIYQSQALLAPSEDARGGGMSRMAGQLGGLASLAGISVGGAAGEDKVAIAVAVLKSRKFVSEFITAHSILPELMAVDSWNPVENKLVFDADLYDDTEDEWVPSALAKPSMWDAYERFTEIFTISEASDTGFVTISVEHQSPFKAREWVELLVKSANRVMKEKDVNEARRSIEFLQNQLAGVSLADMRSVFYQLIEEQTKTMMLAEVRDEYVFATIDPPVVSEEKIKPKRALIVVLGVMLGAMLGVMLVLARMVLIANSSAGKRTKLGV